MEIMLSTYNDMLLSVNIGTQKAKKSVSKPLYLLTLIDAIENKNLANNRILFDDDFLRTRFGQLYEAYYDSKKGFELSFFLRPYYHLGSSTFYHLMWRDNYLKPNNSNTPSGKYLREHLEYAHFDDELWTLLQNAEHREFLRRNIINRFLSK